VPGIAREISKSALWAGRIVSGFAVLFFLVDGVMKLFKPSFVVQATAQLGYPEANIVPRTSILGAIVLTGYLGGACASQFRAGNGWFNMLFAIVFGVLVWVGLWLRDGRVRSLLP
jgi:hypothetical protein